MSNVHEDCATNKVCHWQRKAHKVVCTRQNSVNNQLYLLFLSTKVTNKTQQPHWSPTGLLEIIYVQCKNGHTSLLEVFRIWMRIFSWLSLIFFSSKWNTTRLGVLYKDENAINRFGRARHVTCEAFSEVFRNMCNSAEDARKISLVVCLPDYQRIEGHFRFQPTSSVRRAVNYHVASRVDVAEA